MSQRPEAIAPLRYRLPAVRHLAWMCHAPQLISSDGVFVPQEHLPGNLAETLDRWDDNPRLGPTLLTEQPARRLGRYFETLYQCLMQDLLGWEILLMNQPVTRQGITLGEMDFIVRNPADGAVEHHEIAVKFYLGHAGAGQGDVLWYGPNSRDRLDIKTCRLINHQSRMSERPEARSLLASMGIEAPRRRRIFMPGYLFYPQGTTVPPPAGVSPGHLRGDWLYLNQLGSVIDDTRRLIPLIKPHWLGPWHQPEDPDQQHTEAALEVVRDAGIPRLFAVLAQSPADGHWHETSRLFVVPDTWPES